MIHNLYYWISVNDLIGDIIFFHFRMMTNGLTDIKTTLFMKHRKCQAALEKLLEEQSDIRQHLRATNRYKFIFLEMIFLVIMFMFLVMVFLLKADN